MVCSPRRIFSTSYEGKIFQRFDFFKWSVSFFFQCFWPFGVKGEGKMELIINVYFATFVGREIHAAGANVISC